MKRIAVFAFFAVGMLVAGQAVAADKSALPQAVSGEDLAGMSGGTAVAVTNQNLSAVNSGTVSADQLTTGNVTLQSNAFSGFNGVGNFVINTGISSVNQAATSIAANANVTFGSVH